MRQLLFLSHAEVRIDPAVPVPDWPLSDKGRARHAAFSDRCDGVSAIYCSAERKARDGAEILGDRLGLVPQIVEALHENDRSATGYLPAEEFETVADAFFARPEESVRGWERAQDAQARIVAALRGLVAADETQGDIAVVGHGGVGALFRAHLLGAPIARSHDQPAGGGNVLRVSLPGWRLVEGWVPMERMFGGAPQG
ncbi:phosphoglycerate mutase family protein [Salipiger sp. P9]|uniref:histidine phosphatase family protein n=1 Tax=Salipiger pentaromativorans TaxID=2943193 RepID=UPI0021589A8B|nr:histidine phosphatase family protein [Salipiger pentaromativorans]MCR8546548.1 phosphoglycerate mutase family protein [Salipiger pentaromativorans]